jgi:hypothetical protein
MKVARFFYSTTFKALASVGAVALCLGGAATNANADVTYILTGVTFEDTGAIVDGGKFTIDQYGSVSSYNFQTTSGTTQADLTMLALRMWDLIQPLLAL